MAGPGLLGGFDDLFVAFNGFDINVLIYSLQEDAGITTSNNPQQSKNADARQIVIQA